MSEHEYEHEADDITFTMPEYTEEEEAARRAIDAEVERMILYGETNGPVHASRLFDIKGDRWEDYWSNDETDPRHGHGERDATHLAKHLGVPLESIVWTVPGPVSEGGGVWI